MAIKTITSIFREIAESLTTATYTVDSFNYIESRSQWEISGDFTGQSFKSGEIVTLVDSGVLSGKQKLIDGSDTKIVFSASFTEDTGANQTFETKPLFFAEQLLEAHGIAEGVNNLDTFIYMPVPGEQPEDPIMNSKVMVDGGSFEFLFCTYGREYPKEGETQTFTKLEKLDPAVAKCRELAYEFNHAVRKSGYAVGGKTTIFITEKYRMDINFRSNSESTPKKLFNANYSGVGLRMDLSLYKSNCNG